MHFKIPFFTSVINLSTRNSEVKSIQINEETTDDQKTLYSLALRKFESIPDLLSYYRTYKLSEAVKGSAEIKFHRLGKPLPRVNWLQELKEQPWYQPALSKEEAEKLLLGVSLEIMNKQKGKFIKMLPSKTNFI